MKIFSIIKKKRCRYIYMQFSYNLSKRTKFYIIIKTLKFGIIIIKIYLFIKLAFCDFKLLKSIKNIMKTWIILNKKLVVSNNDLRKNVKFLNK